MKFLIASFAASLLFPVFLAAEAKETAAVRSSADAYAIVAAEMQARRERVTDRKASVEAVPALREWEIDHGKRKTILRQVAPPPRRAPIREATAPRETVRQSPWTKEQLAERMAGRPAHRMLGLSATVYDRSLTEITWRDEAGGEWTALSSIDFNYLGGIGGFEDGTHAWTTFLFIDNVNSDDEAETARRAAEKGFDYTPRTAPRLPGYAAGGLPPTRRPADSATMPHGVPNGGGGSAPAPPAEYIVLADPGTEAPAALREELDALHRYYQANEARLIAEHERRVLLREARRSWRAANPPSDKGERVLNFWVPESPDY